MALRIHSAVAMPPQYSVEQADAADFARTLCCNSEEQERLLAVLYRRTRIQRRGSVLLNESDGRIVHTFFRHRKEGPDRGPTTAQRMGKFEEHAGGLACAASTEAIARAGAEAGDITHLIVVSCTGFYAPGIDFDIVSALGLGPETKRVQIGFMGCHAILNALGVAAAFAGTDPRARLLIVSAELCSLHFQYGWDPDGVVSNALFADGAGAIVAGYGEAADEARDSWTCVANGSVLVPDCADAMTWRIGDAGFQMTLSARVPELIERHLAPWLDQWLRSHGLARSGIKSWAVHPGGPRILSATERALELSPEALRTSREVLSRNGNMSSSTMVFLLDAMMREGAERPCLALGFGPGLTIETALFR